MIATYQFRERHSRRVHATPERIHRAIWEVTADEVFLESVIAQPRGTETTLVERSAHSGLTATSMRFDPDISSRVGVIAMEFPIRLTSAPPHR